MKVIEYLLRRFKNPDFRFSSDLRFSDFFILAMEYSFGFARGFLKLPLRLKFSFIFLGKSVRIIRSDIVKLSKFCKLEDYVYIRAIANCGVNIGCNCKVGAFSRLIVSQSYADPSGFISIGDNCGIGEFSYIGGAGGVGIGNNCIIGQYLSIHPENHNYDQPASLIRNQGVNRNGIEIGNNCWIGSKVTFLDGSFVGSNCVVAAGSVVRGVFPDNVVIAGVPAKIIKVIGV
jgi:acetyltransferase-like isoleucine patch superfamily enzyme